MATSMKQSSNENIGLVVRTLGILTQASATGESLSHGTSEHLIENVLHQNLISLESWLSKPNTLLQLPELQSHLRETLQGLRNVHDVNVRVTFSNTCVSILNILTDLLNSLKDAQNESGEPENSCPVLSIQQEKQISSCLQFVVVLGLCPYLPSGVGIPISQRLGPGQILLASVHDTLSQLDEKKRIEYLLPVLKLFVKMSTCTVIQDMIGKSFLSDIIILLIQIRHSARTILQNVNNDDGVSKDRDTSTLAGKKTVPVIEMNEKQTISELEIETPLTADEAVMHVKMLEEMVQYCNIELDKTIRNASVTAVLKEVLCLLGFAKPSHGVKCLPWLRRILTGILRELIITDSGIHCLLVSFLGDLSSYDTKDWQNCKAVAKIISHCPVNVRNIQQYYSSVCGQLLELIHPEQKSVPVVVTKAVGAAILEMNSLHSDLMTRFCFTPLLTRLVDCCTVAASLSFSNRPGEVVLSEDCLTSCISHCHRLFIQGQESPSSLCGRLQPVLGVLFDVFMHGRTGASHLISPVRELVVGFLNNADTPKGVSCLVELLLPPSKTGSSSYPPLHPSLALASGQTGGLEVVVATHKTPSTESWTQPATAIVALLKHVKSDSLTSETFLALLQKLTKILSEEASLSSDIMLPTQIYSPESRGAKLLEIQQKVALVSLISAVGEEFGASVLHSTSHILVFAKVTLDRCVCIGEMVTTSSFEMETVTMALGLLSVVLGFAAMLSEEDKKVLDSILPLLSSLSNAEWVEAHIQHMAKDLMVSVATRGLVSVRLSGNHTPDSGGKNKKDTISKEGASKPLIEDITAQTSQRETSSSQPETTSADKIQEAFCWHGTKEETCSSPWCVALKEVHDPMIPIKGHGLIQLTRLLEDRGHQDRPCQPNDLLTVFLNNLAHSDSYVYLAAINGLAALSDLCADDIVPVLTAEFRSRCRVGDTLWETTLKVGEALVKATRRLGELAPKYRDVLLSAVLCGSRHDNGLVRASCLSGLAEVCKLLRYSVSPVVHEVLICCHTVLTSDPEPDPRRAAALTLSSLLHGLGRDTTTILSEGLSDLYNSLKQASRFDLDEKVKVHAQLALQELDTIMREFLFPAQDLKKSIKILGYQ